MREVKTVQKSQEPKIKVSLISVSVPHSTEVSTLLTIFCFKCLVIIIPLNHILRQEVRIIQGQLAPGKKPLKVNAFKMEIKISQ